MDAGTGWSRSSSEALENPFIQFMYVVNLDGRKITKNITHIVDRAKYAEMKLDEDLSNRSWFIEPIKTRQGVCLGFLYLPVHRRPVHHR